MKTSLTLVLAFACSTCLAQPPNKTAQELDIREATFRYQFDHNRSALKQNANSDYLAIAVANKKTDPDDAFMKRFAGNKPPVKRHSECEVSPKKGIVDKKTGERGLIFLSGAIKWVSDSEVEVSGGYHEGNLSASGNIYHLKKVDGKWKVTKDVIQWIS
jgi:hypothetical protein